MSEIKQEEFIQILFTKEDPNKTNSNESNNSADNDNSTTRKPNTNKKFTCNLCGTYTITGQNKHAISHASGLSFNTLKSKSCTKSDKKVVEYFKESFPASVPKLRIGKLKFRIYIYVL